MRNYFTAGNHANCRERIKIRGIRGWGLVSPRQKTIIANEIIWRVGLAQWVQKAPDCHIRSHKSRSRSG